MLQLLVPLLTADVLMEAVRFVCTASFADVTDDLDDDVADPPEVRFPVPVDSDKACMSLGCRLSSAGCLGSNVFLATSISGSTHLKDRQYRESSYLLLEVYCA
jgi:hypothetical protein